MKTSPRMVALLVSLAGAAPLAAQDSVSKTPHVAPGDAIDAYTTTEQINGVWQGACYPFREGLSTGIMNVEFSPQGQLIAGGFTTNRQWPVRGEKPFALDRLDWTGLTRRCPTRARRWRYTGVG